MHTQTSLRQQAESLGIKPGDSVIVHSSFKKIGEVEGGPLAVIDALSDLLLPDGALLFPNLNIPHEFTVENPPRFDLKKDTVRNLGVLPEVFKLQRARYFSLHPTHSLMGIGAKAYWVTEGHERAGIPCGPGTPWDRNAQVQGKILLVGVNQCCNTTYHGAEEQIPNSYQLSKDMIDGVVILDGQELIVRSRLHKWGNRPDFNRVNAELIALGHLRIGKFGDADTMCLDAKGFLELCLAKLSISPRYFL